jgi:cobalt-zinc-cadmium efflux system membrane fusion protein
MSKYKTNYFFVSVILCSLFTQACKQKPFEPQVEQNVSDTNHLVILTPEQEKNVNIISEKLQKRVLGEQIQVSGVIDVPPQGLISVNAPYGGFVKKSDVLAGEHVNKGDLLVELVHPDYIQLQQDYLDSKSQLDVATKELERQNALKQEQVASDKIVQQTQADFKIIKNKVNALEEKLLLIGFVPNQVVSKGISSSVKLLAPVSGYIRKTNVNIGKYVTPTDVMFELIDSKHFHVELNVFEKDIAKIEPGQKIQFSLPNDDEKIRFASVYLMGKAINEDRTISIHCHLDKEDQSLLPGMYVKGFIEVKSKDALTLPDEAFVNANDKTYLFMVTKPHTYQRIEVAKGISENGFTEVIFKEKIDSDKALFAVKGAYSLIAKMLNVAD